MIDNVIIGRVRTSPARRQHAGWDLPTCSSADVALALKAIHASRPDTRAADLAALVDIGRSQSWIRDDDLRRIAERTGSPIRYLRFSIARLNAWLASLDAYVERTRRECIPGWRTLIVLAGDEVGLGPWTMTHALLAGARAIVKPSAVEPLATFLFARALLERGVSACPSLLYIASDAAGRETLTRLVAATHQAVVFGEDDTIHSIYGGLPFTPAHKPLAYWSGRSGAIVLPDADLDAAAEAVVRGATEDRGNRCDSTKRVLVPRRHAARFESLLCQKADAIVRGDPLDERTEIGRLDTQARILAERAAAGDEVIYAREPLIARCEDQSRLLREELPYPVIGLRLYDDGEDPVALSNSYVVGSSSGMALVVSIFSESPAAFDSAASRIAAHKVHWNRITTHIDLMTTHQGTHLYLELMRPREICP